VQRVNADTLVIVRPWRLGAPLMERRSGPHGRCTSVTPQLQLVIIATVQRDNSGHPACIGAVVDAAVIVNIVI
jgi:hypothetical protein